MNFLFFATLLLLVVVLPLLLSLRTSKLACVDRFCLACGLSVLMLGVLMLPGAPLPAWVPATLATGFTVASALMSLSGFQILLSRPRISHRVVATILTATIGLCILFGFAPAYREAHIVLGTGLAAAIYVATAIMVFRHLPQESRLMPYLLVSAIFALSIGLLYALRLGLVFSGYDLITPTLENQVWLMAFQAVRILLLPLFFLSVVLMLHGTIIASLRQLVDTDDTTGILSRRTFLHACEAQLRATSLAQASLAPSCLPPAFMLLDLDWFKQVNDRHGHAAGDEALVHFVHCVRDVIGPTAHFFGRLGGEEFGIMLAGIDQAGALGQAEAICACVRRRNVREGLPNAFPITVSIGLAMAEDGDGIDDLMSRADLALYAAKDTGRDRVCLSESRMDVTASLARAALSETVEQMRDRHLSQQKQRHAGL